MGSSPREMDWTWSAPQPDGLGSGSKPSEIGGTFREQGPAPIRRMETKGHQGDPEMPEAGKAGTALSKHLVHGLVQEAPSRAGKGEVYKPALMAIPPPSLL